MEMQQGELFAPRLNELPSKEEFEAANHDRVDAVGLAVTFTSKGGPRLCSR